MGDPGQFRKTYSKPSHPWQKFRIDEEKIFMKEYGFKNKTELWKINSKLSNIKEQVKLLVPKKDTLSENQKQEIIKRLHKMSLVKGDAILEDILAVTLKDICERRLQTLVVRKGLARTVKQARQFIIHEHVSVGEKKITSPSYIVNAEEEALITLSHDSPMLTENHPERIPLKKNIEKEMKEAGLKPHEEKKESKDTKKDKPKRKPAAKKKVGKNEN